MLNEIFENLQITVNFWNLIFMFIYSFVSLGISLFLAFNIYKKEKGKHYILLSIACFIAVMFVFFLLYYFLGLPVPLLEIVAK